MKIVHVFRSPVGGLFRHVRDLVRGQKELGHSCGIICDSGAGGDTAKRYLEDLVQFCDLGIERIAMPRQPGLRDLPNLRLARAFADRTGAQILHGHGAKGGLYARLASHKLGLKSVYTPHRGSLHYDWTSPLGILFLGTEKLLTYRGNGYIFVCDFERKEFEQKIGLSGRPYRVAYNGLWDEEFADALPRSDATDLLFIGEMRYIKGVDLLLKAIMIANKKRKLTLTLVGDGPDQKDFEQLAKQFGIASQCNFAGRKPMREALQMAQLVVLPSRGESFPYVVIEAAAAGAPMIASSVGGIPEVLPTQMMFRSLEPEVIAEDILERFESLHGVRARAQAFRDTMRNKLSAREMTNQICSFYREV
jgi:glycosyltransferase involved in cell wall biosynthesis